MKEIEASRKKWKMKSIGAIAWPRQPRNENQWLAKAYDSSIEDRPKSKHRLHLRPSIDNRENQKSIGNQKSRRQMKSIFSPWRIEIEINLRNVNQKKKASSSQRKKEMKTHEENQKSKITKSSKRKRHIRRAISYREEKSKKHQLRREKIMKSPSKEKKREEEKSGVKKKINRRRLPAHRKRYGGEESQCQAENPHLHTSMHDGKWRNVLPRTSSTLVIERKGTHRT